MIQVSKMRSCLIDVHCHLLPGLDDGSMTTEETIAALQAAHEQGITSFICTPHFNLLKQNADAGQILKAVDTLQKRAAELGMDMSFYPGQEVMYSSEIPVLLERGELLTLAGSKYVLIEFLEDVSYRYIIKAMLKLMDSGFVPILAHYERYRCLMNLERKQALKQENILLQMNFDTVQRTYGILRKNPFQNDLRHGMVDFMGSDCHGTHFRPYRIGMSLRWMERFMDQDVIQRILEENPGKILEHRL